MTSLLTVLLAACQAAGESASEKLNCNIAQPPADSGEMSAEGVQIRIYPRSTVMPTHYSGCQSGWGFDQPGNVPKKAFETLYVNGSAAEMRIYDNGVDGGKMQICRYRNMTLVDGTNSCPTFEAANRRQQSLPPGCLKTLEHSTLGSREPCLRELK